MVVLQFAQKMTVISLVRILGSEAFEKYVPLLSSYVVPVMVVELGLENHHTRLYLTRRIHFWGFYNHRTTPSCPKNGPMGYHFSYGYKG